MRMPPIRHRLGLTPLCLTFFFPPHVVPPFPPPFLLFLSSHHLRARAYGISNARLQIPLSGGQQKS